MIRNFIHVIIMSLSFFTYSILSSLNQDVWRERRERETVTLEGMMGEGRESGDERGQVMGSNGLRDYKDTVSCQGGRNH